MAVFSVTGGGLVFAGGAALGEAFASALVAGAEGVSGAVFAPMSAATGAAAFVAVDALGAGLADVLMLTVFATVADGDVLPLLLATAWIAAAGSVLLGSPCCWRVLLLRWWPCSRQLRPDGSASWLKGSLSRLPVIRVECCRL